MNILRSSAAALLAAATLISLPAVAVEYGLPEKNSRLIGENMEYVVPADSTQPLEAIAAQYQIGLTNMLEACFHWNYKIRNAAGESLEYFYKQRNFSKMIDSAIESGNWTSVQLFRFEQMFGKK